MLDRIRKLVVGIRPSEERDSAVDLLPELNLEDLPTLELADYRALVAEIRPPTDEQIQSFAVFVSEAKSWYKHMSAFGPGTPFYFFVDPCAGLDRIWVPGGVVTFRERTENTPQFHYTWMTTDHYRARFGQLSFCCEAGSELFFEVPVELDDGRHTSVKGLLDNNPSYPVLYRLSDRPVRFPKEVLDAGRANITAVIHNFAAHVGFWEIAFSMVKDDLNWPQGTGGGETVAKIRARCVSVRERSAAGREAEILGTPDSELEALIRPERERLHMEMIAAMKRMRDLVYSAA